MSWKMSGADPFSSDACQAFGLLCSALFAAMVVPRALLLGDVATLQFPASSCGHRGDDELDERKGLGYMIKQSFGKISEVRQDSGFEWRRQETLAKSQARTMISSMYNAPQHDVAASSVVQVSRDWSTYSRACCSVHAPHPCLSRGEATSQKLQSASSAHPGVSWCRHM